MPVISKPTFRSWFPTAEGFYDYQKKQYIYQYKDHLGNVRLSFTKNSAGVLEITDQNDYYPFGMSFLNTSSSYVGAGTYQNYNYNGKELQESGMYDYGARMYMPDIGRWGVVDPLAEKYPSWSPYNYTFNNPIIYKDPDGKDPIIVIWASMSKDKNGKKTRIGHAGICVQNYNKNNSWDGTYTYYDLWPVSADMTDPFANVKPVYNKSTWRPKDGKIENMQNFAKNVDVTESEGYAPDAVVQLRMSPGDEIALKAKYESLIKSNKDYNAKTNNCSTFVSEGLRSVGVEITPETISAYIIGLVKGISPKQTFDTPNNLYNQVTKDGKWWLPTVLKNPGDKTSQDYEDAVLDDYLNRRLGK